jgi:hypothetical protein
MSALFEIYDRVADDRVDGRYIEIGAEIVSPAARYFDVIS